MTVDRSTVSVGSACQWGPTGQSLSSDLQVGPVCKSKTKKIKRKKVVRANRPKASWRPIKARLTRVGGSACSLQAGLGSAQEDGPAQVDGSQAGSACGSGGKAGSGSWLAGRLRLGWLGRTRPTRSRALPLSSAFLLFCAAVGAWRQQTATMARLPSATAAEMVHGALLPRRQRL